jgi:hypothetical protein
VTKEVDEPIVNQGLGLLSFNLFDVPRVTKNNKKVYGFLKLRGNFPGSVHDTKIAQEKAAEIVRLQDSRHPIKIAPVGMWLPITDDNDASNDKVDVKIDPDNKEDIQFRDEAAREKAKKDKAIAMQLAERAQDLRREMEEDITADVDQTSIDDYTKTRFTEDRVYQWVRAKEIDLEEFRAKLTTVREKLYDMHLKNPEFESKGLWIDHMNNVRKQTGVSEYVPNELHEADLKKWFESKSSTSSNEN